MEPFSSCALSLGLLCLMPALDAASKDSAKAEPVPELIEAPTSEAAAPAPTGKASAVLAAVQSFYDGTVDFTAVFKQTYLHPTYGTRTVSHGVLRLLRPGMMVWDYEGKADPDFYVDGQKLFVVEHDTRQVVSQKVEGNSNLSGAMKFLFGGQKLIKEFKVRIAPEKPTKTYGMPGHTVIELKPKEPSPHYKTLLLIVDDASGRVDSFVVRAQDNSTNHFVLTDVKLNQKLEAKDFKYKVPKGYVETRQ